ncbi:ABC transporter permease [bacterium]|nr:ABC transporter permease [bacterium]
MIRFLGAWGIRETLQIVNPVRLFAASAVRLVGSALKGEWRGQEILKQVFECLVMSAPIVLFSLSIVSLMSVLEFSWHMKVVLKQDALVPGFSMVLTVREVAPVVTAMLLASRIGASIAAEIGAMKITEQLDQLKLLAVSEVDYLLIPRWIGSVAANFSLTILSLFTAAMVSCWLGSHWMGYQPGEFYNTLLLFTKGHDLAGCLIKTIVFGTLIPFVSASYGFQCSQGSRGVGEAATQAVTRSSLMIIIWDLLINSLWWMP